MRDKRSAKLNKFVAIGGFGLDQKFEDKTIVLMQGNCTGEETLKVLKRYKAGEISYSAITAEAKQFAQKNNVQLGRDFSRDDWNGFEFGSPEWNAWKQEQKRK